MSEPRHRQNAHKTMSPAAYQHSRSEKIATNTLTLFVRMFVITLVNLYAVRLVLRGLGEIDYGIFNTIAGVVTLSVCISSTLSTAIQRFYSVALGHNDSHELRTTFSASINVVAGLCLLILMVFETVGLWFVDTHLVIPPERMAAAHWIYQFALFVLLLSIMQIPFTAAIFAHESMGTYALISTADCLMRLGIAFLISIAPIDRLVFYSAGLLVTATIVFLLYVFIARSRYPECHYKRVSNHKVYSRLLSFSGWTLFGAMANVGLMQGSVILLNIFFGPIIVASFAISQQINAAFNALSSSMVLSFRPPMIKAYAEGATHYLSQLFVACNKFVAYVLAAAALPIISEMSTILHLWLGQVSADTVLFARLIIVYIVCSAMHSPITIIIQATGRIKEYHLTVESICLMSVPLTWLLFRLGFPPHSVFFSMILLCLIAHCMRIVCIRRYHTMFSLKHYMINIIGTALAIIALSAAATYFIHSAIKPPLIRLCVVAIASPCILLTAVTLLGLSKDERRLVWSLISKKLRP